MKTVLLLRGIPGSGKSTFAKKLMDDNPGMYKRINKDILREMFDNNRHSDANEKFVLEVRDALIVEALKEGKHVIVDDTNLSEKHFNRISQLIHKYNKDNKDEVAIAIKEMDTSLEESIKRDSMREKPVGKKVIKKIYRQFYVGGDRGPHYQPQNEQLQKAILCDLDGTLAILNGRSPYDASGCENDLLNKPVSDLVRNYFNLGKQIILLSGRTDNYKEQTIKWLQKHDIKFHFLIMRATGDNRKDSILKKELFETHIKDKFFIELVLDDRDQVVDMWRLELGLPCLQVNYGDF